jgi:hypothetical protein
LCGVGYDVVRPMRVPLLDPILPVRALFREC